MRNRFTRAMAMVATAAITLLPASPVLAHDGDDFPTTTPIKHVVVIFQENVSFDHYFATYPNAKPNNDGTRFFLGAKDGTPRVNNLESAGLLTNNPNSVNPFRIDRSNANTCDQDHNYKDEQKAFNSGLMDKFVESVSCNDPNLGKGSAMGYYDGNTVTAIWNYAQNFAMSDNQLKKHNLPAVSFLKALSIQDGHAGYSDPLDEQIFLANTINAIMQCDEWKETAVIITWDDSDGWYDHQMGPIVRQSNTTDDLLLGPGNCGSQKSNDVSGGTQNGRCGFGPRIPLLVISPFAKRNYVDHRVLDFSSITRFIEDNFNLGRIGNGSADALAGTLNGLFDFSDRASGHRLILDPKTGQIMDSDPD